MSHSKHGAIDMSLSTCNSQPISLHMSLLICHSQLQNVTLIMSLLTYHSLHVTLNMLLLTCPSRHVTINMSLLTCHSQNVFIIYIEILRDFEISNFFFSDSLTHWLTLTRPRGAFAPKNVYRTRIENGYTRLLVLVHQGCCTMYFDCILRCSSQKTKIIQKPAQCDIIHTSRDMCYIEEITRHHMFPNKDFLSKS